MVVFLLFFKMTIGAMLDCSASSSWVEQTNSFATFSMLGYNTANGLFGRCLRWRNWFMVSMLVASQHSK